MSQSCTVILPTRGFSSFLMAVRDHALQPVSVVGPDDNWKRIELTENGNSLVFNSLIRVAPGDEFSKLILGFHNFARKLRAVTSIQLEELLERISGAQMFIGIVATPGFSAWASQHDSILRTVESLNGIVFTGDSFVGSDGNIIAE